MSYVPPPDFLARRILRGRYLFFEQGRSVGPGCRIVCAGWEECHTDFSLVRGAFEFEAIELLVSGEWVVTQNGQAAHCGAGTVVAYGPRTPVALQAAGPGPHRKYFLDLRGRGAQLRTSDLCVRSPVFLPAGSADVLAGLYEQILSCVHLPEAARMRLANLLAEVLLERLKVETPLRQAEWVPRSGETFRKCRDFLDTHYPSVESIRSAAAACHVSPEYFARLFRRFAGVTAEHYLATLRINHATRLLQQTGISVKAAGLSVGFKDPSHFSRCFKKLRGVPPGEAARWASQD